MIGFWRGGIIYIRALLSCLMVLSNYFAVLKQRPYFIAGCKENKHLTFQEP
jgi:hypothetical protein